MRLLLLLLALLLAGCGGGTATGSGTGTTSESLATRGRLLLLRAAAPEPVRVVAAIGTLDAGRQEFVFARVGAWSYTWPERTGTADEAARSAAAIVLDPAFGPEALFRLLSRTGDDPGQALVLCFGRNLAPELLPVKGNLRARDSLVAVVATPETGGENPFVTAALTPALGNLPTFHALRTLHPDTLTPVLRQEFRTVRAAVPTPEAGEPLTKALKVSAVARYLSGEFGPFAFGFVASASGTAGLRTPAEIIEGLRLDYPGGFQGETRVALLRWARDGAFPVPIAYPVPEGPVTQGEYPYTGNGFTATVRGNAIAEFAIPAPDRMPLNPGATLVEVDEAGAEHLRGTWNGTNWVVPAGAVAPRVAVQPASGSCTVAGIPLEVLARDEEYLYLGSFGRALPDELLQDQELVGRLEYRGRVRQADPRLVRGGG